MTSPSATVQDAIRVLNEALAAEPAAVRKIFACRPDTSGGLNEHPTIQVGPTGAISALGLINGIFGVDSDDCGYIAAEYDVDADGITDLLRFVEPTAPVKP
jgi:hypothetical protein